MSSTQLAITLQTDLIFGATENEIKFLAESRKEFGWTLDSIHYRKTKVESILYIGILIAATAPQSLTSPRILLSKTE